MAKKRTPRKCKYCDAPCTKGVIWAEGAARVPVCEKHVRTAIRAIGGQSEVNTIQDMTVAKTDADTIARGIMVCLYPAEGEADWSTEEPPHLTLVYGGKTGESDVSQDDLLEVAQYISDQYGPMSINADRLDTLGKTGEANVVMMERTPALIDMRRLLNKFNRSEFKTFKPHVTIDNDGDEGGMDEAPDNIYFDAIAVHYGDDVHVFPLGKVEKTAKVYSARFRAKQKLYRRKVRPLNVDNPIAVVPPEQDPLTGLAKADPRDGDGDGFVDDGLPTMRPALLKVPKIAPPRDYALSDPIPPTPGTVAIQPGWVRLFHVTKIERQPGDERPWHEIVHEHAVKLRTEGIRADKARGESYGEPSVVWAQVGKPITDFDNAIVVEWDADPKTLDIGGSNSAEFLGANHSHVTLFPGQSVKPDQIIAVHEPWHAKYRYFMDPSNRDAWVSAVDGSYDNVIEENPVDYGPAIRRVKWEASHSPLHVTVYDNPAEWGKEITNMRIVQPSGAPVRGTPVDPRSLPERLYHVTTHAKAVAASGRLLASGAGGLNGDSNDAIVSLTYSPAAAANIRNSMLMMTRLARAVGPDVKQTWNDEKEAWEGGDPERGKKIMEFLQQAARDEGWEWSVGNPSQIDLMQRSYAFGDWTNLYFSARTSRSGNANPLFFGSDWNRWRYQIDPDDIGIVQVSRDDIVNTGAMVTDFDASEMLRGSKYSLGEYRVYGDVLIDSAQIAKSDRDGDGDGMVTNPITGKDNVPLPTRFRPSKVRHALRRAVTSSDDFKRMDELISEPWIEPDRRPGRISQLRTDKRLMPGPASKLAPHTKAGHAGTSSQWVKDEGAKVVAAEMADDPDVKAFMDSMWESYRNVKAYRYPADEIAATIRSRMPQQMKARMFTGEAFQRLAIDHLGDLLESDVEVTLTLKDVGLSVGNKKQVYWKYGVTFSPKLAEIFGFSEAETIVESVDVSNMSAREADGPSPLSTVRWAYVKKPGDERVVSLGLPLGNRQEKVSFNISRDDSIAMWKAVASSLPAPADKRYTNLLLTMDGIVNELDPPSPADIADGNGLIYKVVDYTHKKWAESSVSSVSMAMHRAVHEALPGVVDPPRYVDVNDTSPRRDADVVDSTALADTVKIDRIYGQLGPVLRAQARAEYRLTQRKLKDVGISTLTLYRGMRSHPAVIGVQRLDAMFARPISSWSASPDVALRFGQMVTQATFPAERIFSFWGNGYGCLGEFEYMVLGAKVADEVRVFGPPYRREYRAVSDGGGPVVVTKGEPDIIFDETDEDADWIKVVTRLRERAERTGDPEDDEDDDWGGGDDVEKGVLGNLARGGARIAGAMTDMERSARSKKGWEHRQRGRVASVTSASGKGIGKPAGKMVTHARTDTSGRAQLRRAMQIGGKKLSQTDIGQSVTAIREAHKAIREAHKAIKQAEAHRKQMRRETLDWIRTGVTPTAHRERVKVSVKRTPKSDGQKYLESVAGSSSVAARTAWDEKSKRRQEVREHLTQRGARFPDTMRPPQWLERDAAMHALETDDPKRASEEARKSIRHQIATLSHDMQDEPPTLRHAADPKKTQAALARKRKARQVHKSDKEV